MTFTTMTLEPGGNFLVNICERQALNRENFIKRTNYVVMLLIFNLTFLCDIAYSALEERTVSRENQTRNRTKRSNFFIH